MEETAGSCGDLFQGTAHSGVRDIHFETLPAEGAPEPGPVVQAVLALREARGFFHFDAPAGSFARVRPGDADWPAIRSRLGPAEPSPRGFT